jgi:cytochrome c oxidase cbb3-type subunit 1
MMYYFVPKQAGRPIYSYRLSVVHFWALIFTYMRAGPHHLHYTALPDWPSRWDGVLAGSAGAFLGAGTINGIMTLSAPGIAAYRSDLVLDHRCRSTACRP